MTMHTPPVALALLLSMAFGAVPRLGTVAQSSGAEARVSAQSAEIGASVDVFVGGVGTHPVYRIPAVTRLATGPKSGRLLAFAEGRPELADVVDNDLVLATSDDGGATWSAPRTIAELANRSLNNPCVVEVREGAHAGRVLLVFQSYPEKHGEHHAVEGYGNDADATSADERVCRSYIVHSDDAGATWSAPREITRSVKRPARATSTASGPGIGIQLAHGAHRGRVLIPFNEGPFDQWRVYAASSDDGGDSWRFGEVAPNDAKGLANEVQMFERADGTVVLNARQHLGAKRRKVAESRDGGMTWTALVDIPELPDPTCMGGIVALGDGRVAFTGCDSESRRALGTLWISRDDGRTWPTAQGEGKWLIEPGGFAYSVPVALGGDAVGVLYEGAGYKRIVFRRIDLPRMHERPAAK